LRPNFCTNETRIFKLAVIGIKFFYCKESKTGLVISAVMYKMIWLAAFSDILDEPVAARFARY
jgi:hypothetical protein